MAEVVLVDKKDNEIGREEKIKAHREAKLHRAFSILVFNEKNEILLQKRAAAKYHSAGLWTNTCCSHPRPGKDLFKEAEKRLKEEMGFKCHLKKSFSFIYKANFDNLTEYEFDHVFFGKFSGDPLPDEKEVSDWKWMGLAEIKKDIKKNRQNYTPWFKIIIDRI